MKKHFSQFLLASLVATSPALAEVVSGKRAIVVTATRLPDIADAATSALTALDSAELERRQTIFAADAIATLPGVTVTQNGPFGGQASIRLRGAANEQTLVLIDGISQNDPSAPGGGFNAANLDAADIDRIEVLRGPQSTLWGSDAIGGMINIVSKRPGEGLTGRVFAEAGSYSTVRGGGSVGFGGDRLDARVGINLIRTNGISKADENNGNTEEDGYRAQSFNGRAGYDITPDLRVEAFGRFVDSKADLDGFTPIFTFGDTAQVTRADEKSGGVSVRYTAFDGKLDNVVTLSRADISRNDRNAGVKSFEADATRDTLRYQGTLKATDYATLSFGAEREEAEIATESFGFFGRKSSGDSSIDGLFLLAELKPIETLTLTGGIRRDDHDQFGEKITGRVGVNWRPVNPLELRASWGQGFKAPTIFQLTSFFFPATVPNTNLKPEEADGWDAAATLHLLDDALTAELGYFKLDTENLINFSGGVYGNIAKAESEGVELTLNYKVNDALTLSGNYTYTDARNAITNTRLIRIPESAGFVEVDWKATNKLGLTLTAHYNGEEDDVDENLFPAVNDAWTKINLAARYDLNDRVELFGRVENLTDEKYQDSFGYGEPGASVYGGVRLTFE